MAPATKMPALKFRANSREMVLKSLNLNSESMSDCVGILQQWINQQNHFNKKDFSQNFLEATIISCKGSVERAKARLDKYCTLRTVMPKFFDKINARRDFEDMHPALKVAVLPQCTEDLYRVIIIKVNTGEKLNLAAALDFYKFGTLCLEYLKANDHFKGTIVILDYLDVSIKDVLPILNPADLANAVKLYTEGYGMRIKGIHFITPSKMVETVVTLLKSVVSAKVGNRIHVHSSIDSLHKMVSLDILPAEYGGDEKAYCDIFDDWLDMLSIQENLNYLEEMKDAYTNENFRISDEFNCKDIGMPGTFRALTVD